MKNCFQLIVLSIVLFSGSLFGTTVITYELAVAPNPFGSPSYAGWQSNAILAFLNSVTTFGTVNTPEYFFTKTSFTTADEIVTDFPSWEAVADPGAAFGPAYANELGNRITMATFINDSLGAQVDIANGLSINIPAFGDNPGLSGSTTTYSARTVGVISNGMNPPTILTSGTGLVDFIATFPGFGFAALTGDPLGATQANIDDLVLAIQSNPENGSFTDCTTYNTVQGCAGPITITEVTPEPETLTMLGGGLLTMLWILKRREGISVR